MGNDIRYMPEKLEQASNFANKIWNAAKFVITNTPDEEKVKEFCHKVYDHKAQKYNPELLEIEDKWILNKLDKLVAEVTRNIENYDLGIALDKIYNFIWNEFCDWYIEIAKLRIYSEDEETRVAVSDILNHVLGTSMKLLHPFMPFVTSEIYENLVRYGKNDLMVSSWPVVRKEFIFEKEEETIEKLKQIIVEIRNIRANKNIHPSKKSELIIVTTDYVEELKQLEAVLLKLGFANNIKIQTEKVEIPKDSVQIITDGIELYMPLIRFN